MEVDHPGDFSNQVGQDLYLNPWWGLRFQCEDARQLCLKMTEKLGKPDLWFQGSFHELLWGPRHIHRTWRPGLSVSVSGGNGKTWFHLWLPWRSKYNSGFIEDRRGLESESWLEHLWGQKRPAMLASGVPILRKVSEPCGYNGLPRSFEKAPAAYGADLPDTEVVLGRDLDGLAEYVALVKVGGSGV